MFTSHRFGEYIEYLRDTLVHLVKYRESIGRVDQNLLQVKDDLFDEDPFVVFTASIAATVILSDKSIYH